jgi:hypothetical protein
MQQKMCSDHACSKSPTYLIVRRELKKHYTIQCFASYVNYIPITNKLIFFFSFFQVFFLFITFVLLSCSWNYSVISYFLNCFIVLLLSYSHIYYFIFSYFYFLSHLLFYSSCNYLISTSL